MSKKPFNVIARVHWATVLAAACLFAVCSSAGAKTVVFWQAGFPTVESQPVSRATLESALRGMDVAFADAASLNDPATLRQADLLVLPYGSAFPAGDWGPILAYLQAGGNMLILGGQALRVPVEQANGSVTASSPQDTYSRAIGIQHTYEVPQKDETRFEWKQGYTFLKAREVRARKFFVLEGHIRGLGYMLNPEGERVAAPVVVSDTTRVGRGGDAMLGSRIVMLDFDPQVDYWASPEGVALIRDAASYAAEGATLFWLETQYAALEPGETPEITVHLRNVLRQRRGLPQRGAVNLELRFANKTLESRQIQCSGVIVDASVDFHRALSPGFYTVRGTYEAGGEPQESYENGFWVENGSALNSGPVLGVKGNFLTADGKPYFPFGTNYFTTEENGWDFSGPRNTWVLERDFAAMEKHGVTFMRTGVWGGQDRLIDAESGGASQRFLRNLEAYLLCAREHHIFVNFNFFAFSPQTERLFRPPGAGAVAPVRNPYLNPAAIRAEQDYVLSVVSRFENVPFLCWDLINEPSFSNPGRLWKGNTPNGDPSELRAWHEWLRARYGTIDSLAASWSVTPEQLGSFNSVPLPQVDDLTLTRYGNANEVRAFDYNLFAQDMFSRWVHSMVEAIRSTGSRQLIDVGQDEGGVTNRVLNQFYGGSGVSFTTDHTYWQDDALLWDSVAAKRPGVPNITGETGYQPVWLPNGEWRYDEISGLGLLERKWALGFADGTSGALQWDWAREPYFGMLHSDGSSKLWEYQMARMGDFAKKAAPYATGLIMPDVVIVLPQSLQLSVFNPFALEAQQNCVRALYQYARSEAYVVGEYQIGLLGNPKLIILPSPWVFSQHTWEAILEKVRNGATLLITGPFDDDPHFHSTGRQKDAGINYQPGLLATREIPINLPGGTEWLSFPGDETTYLERAYLQDGKTFDEVQLGKGKILFVPVPLELNTNLEAIGAVYRYALSVAGVQPVYATPLHDPGILICPTRFPDATLYVLTSESAGKQVSFRDKVSGKEFFGQLDPGR
ncbi:MAG: beta-galactosidase, partial [Terriglobia bacterium]